MFEMSTFLHTPCMLGYKRSGLGHSMSVLDELLFQAHWVDSRCVERYYKNTIDTNQGDSIIHLRKKLIAENSYLFRSHFNT